MRGKKNLFRFLSAVTKIKLADLSWDGKKSYTNKYLLRSYWALTSCARSVKEIRRQQLKNSKIAPTFQTLIIL